VSALITPPRSPYYCRCIVPCGCEFAPILAGVTIRKPNTLYVLDSLENLRSRVREIKSCSDDRIGNSANVEPEIAFAAVSHSA